MVKSYKSWTITDEIRKAIKDEISVYEPDPNKEYKMKPGGGRKPPDMRKILESIFYVLRTGCQWKAVQKEYASESNIHRYFQNHTNDGFFARIWFKNLEKYDG